jgi:hypothetical protein
MTRVLKSESLGGVPVTANVRAQDARARARAVQGRRLFTVVA